MVCRKCGRRLPEGAGFAFCLECGAPLSHGPGPAWAGGVPFDRPDLPLAYAWWQTFHGFLRHPKAAAAVLAERGARPGRALVFAFANTFFLFLMTRALVPTAETLMAGRLLPSLAGIDRTGLLARAADQLPLAMAAWGPLLILSSPMIIVAGLLIAALLDHICLLLLGRAGGGFGATFTAACYATAPNLLGIFAFLPLVGGLLWLWHLGLKVVAYAAVHRSSTGPVLLAVLLPYLAGCCCLFGAVALAAGALLSLFGLAGG